MATAPETPSGERRFETTENEVERMLRAADYGVLSPAAGGEAYAVPMSFGYDGGGLYFVFRRPAERSRKLEFIEGTDRATFVVPAATTKHDWASVVEGAIGPVRTRTGRPCSSRSRRTPGSVRLPRDRPEEVRPRLLPHRRACDRPRGGGPRHRGVNRPVRPGGAEPATPVPVRGPRDRDSPGWDGG